MAKSAELIAAIEAATSRDEVLQIENPKEYVTVERARKARLAEFSEPVSVGVLVRPYDAVVVNESAGTHTEMRFSGYRAGKNPHESMVLAVRRIVGHAKARGISPADLTIRVAAPGNTAFWFILESNYPLPPRLRRYMRLWLETEAAYRDRVQFIPAKPTAIDARRAELLEDLAEVVA